MRPTRACVLICSVLAGIPAVHAAGPAAAPPPAPTRQIRLGVVDLSAPVPDDLRSPEGRSRWDLSRIVVHHSFVRSISGTDQGFELLDSVEAGTLSPWNPGGGGSFRTVHAGDSPGAVYRTLYKDDASPGIRPEPAAPTRWLLPDRYPGTLRPGARETLDLVEESEGGADRLRAEIETVGIGWVLLPSGPREVVLQRVLLLRERSGGRGFVPD